MPRIPRPVLAGLPHHVTQRGNRREAVFFDDADRAIYLRWLGEYCVECGVEVLAYCLMPNHVHIVAVPSAPDSLERAFRPLHTRYAMRVNRRRGTSGHLWQGRYFSSVLDESYFWAAVRYVERNPVRAAMVARAEDYRWSSAAAHCGTREDTLLMAGSRWADELRSVPDWSGWLAEADRPAQLAELRRCIDRGAPCGSGDFVRQLEQRLGRSLSLRERGRPMDARQR